MEKQRHIIGVNTIDYGHSIHQRNVRGNPPESTRQEKELQERRRVHPEKKAYMDAKAAISALVHLNSDSDDDSNESSSESDYDSNTSSSTFNGRDYSNEEGGSDSS